MPLYEVKIETRAYEWYEVSARNEKEARERWHEGTLTGTEEVEVLDVLSVTEQFDGDDEEVTYAEDAEDDYSWGDDPDRADYYRV